MMNGASRLTFFCLSLDNATFLEFFLFHFLKRNFAGSLSREPCAASLSRTLWKITVEAVEISKSRCVSTGKLKAHMYGCMYICMYEVMYCKQKRYNVTALYNRWLCL